MNSQANQRQIAGDHYKTSSVQTWDVIIDAYGPSFLIGNAVKYITRWRAKSGTEDLRKADHYIEKLQEWAISNHAGGRNLVEWGATSVPCSVIVAFCSANKLWPLEREIVEILFGPWEVAHLTRARGHIQCLIDTQHGGRHA